MSTQYRMMVTDVELAALEQTLERCPSKLLSDWLTRARELFEEQNNEAARRYRARAVSFGSVQFDGDAIVSMGDSQGAFVAGWVWIPTTETL